MPVRILHQNLQQFHGNPVRGAALRRSYDALWQAPVPFWGGPPRGPLRPTLVVAGFTELMSYSWDAMETLGGMAGPHMEAGPEDLRVITVQVGFTAVGAAPEYIGIVTGHQFRPEYYGMAYLSQDNILGPGGPWWQAAAWELPDFGLYRQAAFWDNPLRDDVGSRPQWNVADTRGVAFVAGVDLSARGANQRKIIGFIHANYTIGIRSTVSTGRMAAVIRERVNRLHRGGMDLDPHYLDAPFIIGGDFNSVAHDQDDLSERGAEAMRLHYADDGTMLPNGLRRRALDTTAANPYDFWLVGDPNRTLGAIPGFGPVPGVVAGSRGPGLSDHAAITLAY